jgi:thioredoxin reductase
MRERVLGHVPITYGSEVIGVAAKSGRVELTISNREGATNVLVADHVISATGYLVDVRSLRFLNAELLAKLKQEQNYPVLSTSFESSIPGLFFIGPIAGSSFGPLMRFAYGAGFASRRLACFLTRKPKGGRSYSTDPLEASVAA